MKLSAFTFVALLTHQILCSDNDSISRAVNEILHKFFAKNSLNIEVVYGSGKKSSSSEKLIDDILNFKRALIVFKVVKYDDKSLLLLNTSSIVVFNSAKSFRKMCNKTIWQTDSRVRHQHLVYFPGATLSDFECIKDGFMIDNVDFLMETKKSIELVTSFMFTSKECRKNQFRTINRFEESSMKWEKSIFYPHKYRNLHLCKLTIGKLYDPVFYKSLAAFAKLINSSRILSEGREKFKSMREYADFLDNNLIVISDGFSINTYPMTFNYYVIVIPPGELYTPLEKMILPFEEEVWIAISVTLSIGFVTIQVVNCAGTKVKRFVFGQTVTTPTMNMIDIILNGGQVQTARRNFARFIFTLFVIWSLIIRTCYQSKLFELLQSDLRKPEMKSFDELIENNFSFFDFDQDYIEKLYEVKRQ